MDRFVEALLGGKTDRIPDEYDWFAPLVGDWDCNYYDEPEVGRKHHVKGEWIFRRILEGTGVQDVFVVSPGRGTGLSGKYFRRRTPIGSSRTSQPTVSIGKMSE